MSTPDSLRPAMWCGDAGPAHTWVVDVANVIGARPDGWWRDRAGAADRLRRKIFGLLAAPPADVAPALPGRIVLVLEGAARPAAAPGETAAGSGVTVAVVHAAAGGDDAIVDAARTAAEPVLVVTSDRGLCARVHALGAATVGAGALWRVLDPVASPGAGRERAGNARRTR